MGREQKGTIWAERNQDEVRREGRGEQWGKDLMEQGTMPYMCEKSYNETIILHSKNNLKKEKRE